MLVRRIIIIVVAIGLAIILAFLPEKDNSNKPIDPETLHYELNQNTRFLSTDNVADLLINQDPSLLLIDIRDKEEFEKYSLPGAINVPLNDLLNDDYAMYFKQDFTKNVLFGNGSVKADEAWMILRRMNYSNLFVMEGGLNRWVETILRPTMPSLSETDVEVLDQYSFRKAASQYFGMGSENKDSASDVNKPAPKPIIVKERKATKVAGGC